MSTQAVNDTSVLVPDVDPTARAAPADATAATPDIARTGRLLTSARGRSTALTILAILAVLYTVYFARDFLLPITVALLLDFLLSPVVRALGRLHLPVPLGAGIVVLSLVAAVGTGAYQLSDPVQRWATEAPVSLTTAQAKMRRLLRPVQRTAEQVERATTVTPTTGGGRPTEVVVKGPSIVSRVFGTTQKLLAGLLEVVILLYFLLSSGDLFVQKVVKVIPREEDKRTVVTIAREIEGSISTYLLTTAAINVTEGLVVAGVLALLGMPNALFWGTCVVVVEFVPYLGATVMTGVLALAALATFDNVGHAMLMPGSFLAINLIQGNLVTPMLLGHRLTLNPVAIFVSVALWWWMWGVPGAFVAVPLLAAFKTVCDHAPPFAAFGEFLGQRDERERRWVARG